MVLWGERLPIDVGQPVREVATGNLSDLQLTQRTFYYPKSDLSGLEMVDLQVEDRRGELSAWIGILLARLAEAPGRGLLAPLPKDLRLRSVFLDQAGTLFVDMPDEVTQFSSAGVEFEMLSIEALVSSLGRNVSQARRVKFLVGGQERETLWGHVYLKKSFSIPDRGDLI